MMKVEKICIFATEKSGCGAVGSVHVWGACGRWFESSHPDFFIFEHISYENFHSNLF